MKNSLVPLQEGQLFLLVSQIAPPLEEEVDSIAQAVEDGGVLFCADRLTLAR